MSNETLRAAISGHMSPEVASRITGSRENVAISDRQLVRSVAQRAAREINRLREGDSCYGLITKSGKLFARNLTHEKANFYADTLDLIVCSLNEEIGAME